MGNNSPERLFSCGKHLAATHVEAELLRFCIADGPECLGNSDRGLASGIPEAGEKRAYELSKLFG
jgi:hypothetical protein